MNNNTVYVGMDVHKESFSLCAFTIEADKGMYYQRTESDFKNVLKYLDYLRTIYGYDVNFVCGYEAGCLGYNENVFISNSSYLLVSSSPSTITSSPKIETQTYISFSYK